MNDIKIGVLLTPQFGDMAVMRDRWVEAEQIGADGIYTADHFFATVLNEKALSASEHAEQVDAKNFEATTVQAAMAATTSRVKIGCLVHGNSFRNPNLLADMARTIDHIAGGGRFILGLGSGYEKREYDEYGYEYGTQKSRTLDLVRNVPIIKARFEKLNPPPVSKIPLLLAGMGPIGMRLVAEHADMWHVYGHKDFVKEKTEALKRVCDEVGRDFESIEKTTFFVPHLLGDDDNDPEVYLKLGIRNIITITQGPDWDFSILERLLAWRKAITSR